jgi:hypothetical protein
MQRTVYAVEVMKPGSESDVLAAFDVERPLGPFAAGQRLRLASFPDKGTFDIEATVARVEWVLFSARTGEVTQLMRVFLEDDARSVVVTPLGLARR